MTSAQLIHVLLPYAPVAAFAAALLVLLLLAFEAAARRRETHRLRLLLEQALAAQRGEAEMTRLGMHRAAVEMSERLARMGERIVAFCGALDTGLQAIRTVLSREQGDLRLALADGQEKSARQIGLQFESTRTLLEAKLREMREGNEAKLAEIQKTVNEQLHAAVERQMNESFNRVIDQFAAVQKAMGDVQAVTAQIGDIKRIFSNVKTRGGWGETQVRAMLDDVLPPGAYETNCKLRPDSDEAVEFAVVMPMRGDGPAVPADRRQVPAGGLRAPARRGSRRAMPRPSGPRGVGSNAACATRRARYRASTSARRSRWSSPCSICRPTRCTPRLRGSPGLIDEIGRQHRVLVLGPSLFPALLRTIHLGFVTLALEEKAGLIRELLGATRTEMLRMDEVLDKLGKQAGSFASTIERARTRTRAVSRKLRGVEAVEPHHAEQLLELEAESPEE